MTGPPVDCGLTGTSNTTEASGKVNKRKRWVSVCARSVRVEDQEKNSNRSRLGWVPGAQAKPSSPGGARWLAALGVVRTASGYEGAGSGPPNTGASR